MKVRRASVFSTVSGYHPLEKNVRKKSGKIYDADGENELRG